MHNRNDLPLAGVGDAQAAVVKVLSTVALTPTLDEQTKRFRCSPSVNRVPLGFREPSLQVPVGQWGGPMKGTMP